MEEIEKDFKSIDSKGYTQPTQIPPRKKNPKTLRYAQHLEGIASQKQKNAKFYRY